MNYTRQDYCQALRAFLELGDGIPELRQYSPALKALLQGLEDGYLRRDTLVPECACPWCGYRFDAAMAADPAYPDATPSPGDVSVCTSCAQILVFADDLTVRAAMPGEVEFTPELRRAQQAARTQRTDR